jgi:hypothetical protein
VDIVHDSCPSGGRSAEIRDRATASCRDLASDEDGVGVHSFVPFMAGEQPLEVHDGVEGDE